MQPTLLQSGALYLAQHKVSKRRAELFRQFRFNARNEPPDRKRITFEDATVAPCFHRDNGR
jgi:hypothetical protein